MSELSKKMLSSSHAGVHDQFDCVYAAILAHKRLNNENDLLNSVLRGNHKKIIKKVIKGSMAEIGARAGFFRVGLSSYAFEFWEIVVSNRLGGSYTKEAVSSLAAETLSHLSTYLDEDFKQRERADAIAFLKSIV